MLGRAQLMEDAHHVVARDQFRQLSRPPVRHRGVAVVILEFLRQRAVGSERNAEVLQVVEVGMDHQPLRDEAADDVAVPAPVVRLVVRGPHERDVRPAVRS